MTSPNFCDHPPFSKHREISLEYEYRSRIIDGSDILRKNQESTNSNPPNQEKQMKKTIITASLLLAGAGAFLSASAQQEEPTPEQLAVSATETRQGVFKLLSYNMGTISGMARGTVEFDAAIAERNATRIAMLAPMIPELFAARDTRAFAVETEALPLIWDSMDEFNQKAVNLVNAANTFAEIARAGDRTATIAAVRAFGGACGNCHETFRAD
jgi:cytochrome c556